MKFNLHEYFLTTLKEAQDEEVQDENSPQATQNAQQSVAQNQTPQKQSPGNSSNPKSTEMTNGSNSNDSGVFSNFIGSTISDISFKKNGSNGGQITVSLSNSNVPLKISWIGDKVTVTKPDGNIVGL